MNKKKVAIMAIVGVLVVGALAYFLLLKKDKTYIVVFDTDGGTEIAEQEVKEGDKVRKPRDPEKEGYEFVMWESNGSEYDFSKKVESNLRIVAKYTKNETTYKVKLTVDGVTKELDVSKITSEELEKLFPSKEGYELKLYANGKEYELDTPLEADIELTGKYEKVSTYTVKFNSNGGSTVSSQSIAPNGKVVEPENPTREAYIFDGWYINSTKYDFDTVVTRSFTLTAKWSEDPSVKRYNVTFDSDGGSKVNSQRIIENKTVTKPANPTKTGYKFIEWQLDNKAYDFKTKVTKDLTLKAKWEEVKTYTVSFNTDGGTTVASQKVEEGKTATKPANPTKEGYEFIEWQLDGRVYNFSTPVTSDIEIKAYFEKERAKYTVTFNSDGGTSVPTQTVSEGDKVKQPANPTKDKYRFKNWVDETGAVYDFNKEVTKNITLKATWEEIVNYTVRIVKVDNYSPDSRLVVYKNDTQISYSAIKFMDGTTIPNGVTRTTNLEGETSFKVVLATGEEVTATVVR